MSEDKIVQKHMDVDPHPFHSEEHAMKYAQQEKDRGRGKKYRTCARTFSGKIRCGECGCFYGSKTRHSTDKYRKEIWRCNHKYDGDRKCSTPALTDDEIKAAFLSAANKLLATKAEVIANGREMQELLFSTDELETQRDKLMEEAQVVADAVQQNIAENARTALDQTAYQKRYNGTGRPVRQAQAGNRLPERKDSQHPVPERKR